MPTFLASFPNSRIESRPATTSETTAQVSLPTTPADPTVLAAANLNRTGLTVRNTHTSQSMRFGYPNADGSAPTVAQLTSSGKLLRPAEESYIDTNQNVYGINLGADAFDSAAIDSMQVGFGIMTINFAADPGLSAVQIGDTVTVSGAANAGNNGTFTIIGVSIAGKTISCNNPAAVDEGPPTAATCSVHGIIEVDVEEGSG